MKTISFWVPGLPKGQPRPRAFARGGKARVYDPGTAEGWKGCIAQTVKPYLPEVPIETPITLYIHFWMPRPKKHFKRGELRDGSPSEFTGKPDCDNLAKAVMDCLTFCGMWRDDAQIWRLNITKQYSVNKPGACIEIHS